MSLKSKFILTFLLISVLPLLLATGAGYYHITKINRFSIVQTQEALKENAENLVEEKAQDIVKTISLYLQMKRTTKGNINWETLQYDPTFMQIGVQMVGKTGYSFLVFKQGKRLILFLHPNPKLIGADLNKLASKNPEFWKIVKGPRPGERFSKGYYSEKGPNGQMEKKFMVVIPVPNTPLMVAATIYTKEIQSPIIKFRNLLLQAQKKFLYQFLVGGLITIIVVVLVAIIFANRLAKPILHLTEVAERISLGELNVPIDITSTDEIGDLADALRRMQASLRKAIQRLQRRLKK